MSNYTQTTFFAPKDLLLSGNPAKLIKGADVDPELAAIATAIATKYDSSNITVITPTTDPVVVSGHWTHSPTTAGTSVTINNSTAGGAVTTKIASAFNASGAVPLLQLVSTASNGFAALSICGNSATPGTNDLSIFQNGTTGDAVIVNNAVGAITMVTAHGSLSLNTTGNVTIGAPSTGISLQINGNASFPSAQISGGANTLAGLQFVDGQSGNHTYIVGSGIGAVGSFGIFDITNAALRVGISTSGNVTVSAATSGSSLSVAAAAGQTGLQFVNGSGAAECMAFGTNYFSTGASVPTLGSNKPGSASTPQAWIVVTVNGTQGYIPVWS